jgi:hypothetical protein
MKTAIKYIDTTTEAGIRLANMLICQGWRVSETTPYGVKFYKIYLK